ncbi:MAG: biopolymer transporter ExbD [bacterium]
MKKFTVSKGSYDEISEINITPMADLSLTLLIILMIVSPMIMQSMLKVFASHAAVQAVERQQKVDKPLYIEVKPNGLYLNSKKMESDRDLYLHLKGELSRNAKKAVMVTADKGVTHGNVVHVLDLAKQAGAEKLSLIKKAAAK